MALTVNKVAKLVEVGRYGDGKGLYLQVGPHGVQSWLLRYERADCRPGPDGKMIEGKRRERWMGLGSAADFSLEQARESARAARQLLKGGVDPLDARKAERIKQATEAALAAAKDKTFKEAAEQYFKFHAPKWKNAKHAA
jgi:hypothetical protein